MEKRFFHAVHACMYEGEKNFDILGWQSSLTGRVKIKLIELTFVFAGEDEREGEVSDDVLVFQ